MRGRGKRLKQSNLSVKKTIDAMIILFRNMEAILLAVSRAEVGKKAASYRNARKAQLLT